MSILTVSNLEKSFGTDLLFRDVNFSIAAGQKFGLVGRNGCGKTTLLKILLRQEEPDAGRVTLASGRRLGYLRQEAPVHPEHTIWEEVQQVYTPLRNLEAKLEAVEAEMAETHTDEALDEIMTRYSHLREEYEAAGGYAEGMDAPLVLEKLGFKESDYGKIIGSCSGGEQTRIALAKIVLSRPDVLILDEPTNHLDIDATEWLEGFLKNYEGAILLVSHDRYFRDAVVDTIAEIEIQKLTLYKGNYSQFAQTKAEQHARQQAMYEQQQAEIERLQGLIKRFMGADATASKIRLKTLGRIDRMEKIERPKTDTTTMRAQVDAAGAGRIGREVVRFDDLGKNYGERTLFAGLNAVIERGDRTGVVGPNGAGKTTLVKIILGNEQPTSGTIIFGHNVRISYFSQHASDKLDAELSVLNTILTAADMTETEGRNYLARFLFTGDDVFKTVGMLSGGEKNKLALATMILEPCNLLVLDEPTNHLDIASCDSLTQMLSNYDGTLLLISHDRYLLNAVTTKTLALLGDSRGVLFEGKYSAWRDAWRSGNIPASLISGGTRASVAKPAPVAAKVTSPAAKAAQPAVVAAPKPAAPQMNARELSKARIKAKEVVVRAEGHVAAVETRIAEVESLLASPSNNAQEMVTLAAEHTRLQDEIMDALAAWEKATADQDALG